MVQVERGEGCQTFSKMPFLSVPCLVVVVWVVVVVGGGVNPIKRVLV